MAYLKILLNKQKMVIILKNKNIRDALYLAQITLCITLIAFFIMTFFVKEFEIIYKLLLGFIFILIGYNGSERNSKVITYLYYFSSFCIFLSIFIGVL